MTNRPFSVLGAVLAGLGVLIGAYHAHGLEDWLLQSGIEAVQVQQRLDSAEVAVRYQMNHALALLILGSFFARKPSRILAVGCWLICVGLLLFCGGIYVIVFAGDLLHWSIVPLGGVLLIAAWIIVSIALGLQRKADT